MQHRSLIRRIEDYLASACASNKANVDPSSIAEEILKEFRDDEDFNRRIVSVADRFSAEGLDTSAYLKAALKKPQLFSLLSETIEANIRGLAACFPEEGLDTAAYLKAALKQPPLFYQSPETIEGNIRGLSARFPHEGLDATA